MAEPVREANKYIQNKRQYSQTYHAVYRRNYLKTHPEARLRNYQNVRELARQRKKQVIEYYSKGTNQCACCGESTVEFLTIDHSTGNGNKHRETIKAHTGNGFYLWLIRNNFPDGYQVLCWNCNCGKAHFKTCPHTWKDKTN